MRILFAFSFVLFFATTSIGQSFSLQELIKMSKMSVDDFDTYVTSKSFVFEGVTKDDHLESVDYAVRRQTKVDFSLRSVSCFCECIISFFSVQSLAVFIFS